MSDEKSLTMAKLAQHVSSETKLSLQSDSGVKNMDRTDENNEGGVLHPRQSDPELSLQTDPDMSTARHRLNSCSVERHVGLVVGRLLGNTLGDLGGCVCLILGNGLVMLGDELG